MHLKSENGAKVISDHFIHLASARNFILYFSLFIFLESYLQILGAERDIKREVFYQLDESSKILKVFSSENLNLSLSIRKNVGVSVAAFLEMNFNGKL